MEYQDRSYLNSNDRRVKKTNRALKDSLDELLKTKDFHKITVQNIIDLADITKSTFIVTMPINMSLLNTL